MVVLSSSAPLFVIIKLLFLQLSCTEYWPVFGLQKAGLTASPWPAMPLLPQLSPVSETGIYSSSHQPFGENFRVLVKDWREHSVTSLTNSSASNFPLYAADHLILDSLWWQHWFLLTLIYILPMCPLSLYHLGNLQAMCRPPIFPHGQVEVKVDPSFITCCANPEVPLYSQCLPTFLLSVNQVHLVFQKGNSSQLLAP
jgi:hypothetical protein